MTTSEVPIDRGRPASPLRTNHFLPRRHSSRERSPYIVTDRITGYRTPGSQNDQDANASDVQPRIAQPYKTSFSAVTFPRRGKIRATLPDKIKGGVTYKPKVMTDQRSGSHDLLSSANNSNYQSRDELNHATPERAASCDLLDDSGCQSPLIEEETLRPSRSNPFENRRHEQRYSSTPSRILLNVNSPVAKAIRNKQSQSKDYARTQSNVSTSTQDSVFMPNTPRPHDVTDGNTPSSVVSQDDPSSDISKPVDSGFVEGNVEKKWLIEREYGHVVTFTYSDLKKLKNKNKLPEPNEETADIVEQLKEQFRQQNHNDAAGGENSPEMNHDQNGRVPRGRLRTTLGKKAHSIANFLRRMQSPRTSNAGVKSRGDKKTGKRSRSAGRLEGNRVFHTGKGSASNSSLGGVYENEESSFSITDQSSSAFHTSSSPSEPMRSSDTDITHPNQPTTGLPENVQVLIEKDSSANVRAKQDNTPTSNMTSTSTRRILKSLEDNVGAEKSVYHTFKAKQSPGYRRHAEAISMKPQALRAVEIPILTATRRAASEDGLADSASHDLSIGDCSLDIDKTGSAGSLNKTNGEVGSNSVDASKVTLNSKDQSQSSSHNASVHLPNGHTSAPEPKTPSYVKLSCAVSGYKSYGSSNTPSKSHSPASKDTVVSSTKHNGVDVVAVDNNNVVNGGGGGFTAGEAVTLEYTPSKNAYVKKVSQRFEQSTHTGNNVSDNSSDLTLRPQQHNGASLNSSSNNTGLPVATINSQHAERKQQHAQHELSNALCDSNESKVLAESEAHPQIQPSDNVDSENINFSLAKQAFVHENTSSGGRDTTYSLSNSKRSADKPAKELEALAPQSTHSSELLHEDSSLDRRSNGVSDDYDVTDDAMSSRQRHHDVIITDTRSITLKDTPAEQLVVTESEKNEDSNEHLLATTATAHSDKTTVPSVHMNGGVVNGVEFAVPTVQRSVSNHSSSDSLDTTTSSKDGEYFLQVMAVEEARLNALCATTEHELQTIDMPDDVSGKVRAAVGKGHLLTSKKFKQFRGLCERNMTQGAEEDFQTTCQDLAGFWDMVLIQVEDVYELFNEVNKLRQNDWKPASSKSSPLLSSKPSTPKTPKSRSSARATPKSAKAQEAAKAREDARRKLMEAKKAGRRHRKTSENADDIEIKIVT